MFRLLKFYFLNRLVQNPTLTSQIYHMIYQNGQPPKNDLHFIELPFEQVIQENKFAESKNMVQQIQSVPSRKHQLLEGLNYLKSKQNKSKKDFESISVIEAALKNEI